MPVEVFTHCQTCGKRKQPPARIQKGLSPEVYEADPFCSSDCARKHYGTEVGRQEGYGLDYGATKAKKKAKR